MQEVQTKLDQALALIEQMEARIAAIEEVFDTQLYRERHYLTWLAARKPEEAAAHLTGKLADRILRGQYANSLEPRFECVAALEKAVYHRDVSARTIIKTLQTVYRLRGWGWPGNDDEWSELLDKHPPDNEGIP